MHRNCSTIGGIRVRLLKSGKWRVTYYDPRSRSWWYRDGIDLAKVLDAQLADIRKSVLAHRGYSPPVAVLPGPR